MDGKTPFRRVTRGIVRVDKTNYGTPSFDLGVFQLDNDNADIIAELKEDKLKAETRRKSDNDRVNIRNSMVDCQSKDELINASKNINVPTCYVLCGLFIVAYAEYLSHEKSVSPEYYDAEAFRTSYAIFLWQRRTQKNEIGTVSDDESPERPVRPQFECESSDMIIMP
ncbi:hypothetical protein FXO38_13425 [Capsicum annuum]|nr:hypothetical protein FXO38_13425 [Capsicum annuum]